MNGQTPRLEIDLHRQVDCKVTVHVVDPVAEEEARKAAEGKADTVPEETAETEPTEEEPAEEAVAEEKVAEEPTTEEPAPEE